MSSIIIEKKWEFEIDRSYDGLKIPIRLKTGDTVEGNFHVFDGLKVNFKVKGPRGGTPIIDVERETYVFTFTAQHDGIYHLHLKYYPGFLENMKHFGYTAKLE